MLIIEIDRLDAEPAQTSFARFADIVGFAAHASTGWVVRIADDAEFRGEHDLIATVLDRATDELLVRERSVHVGGVEMRDAEFDGAVNGGDRFVVVPLSVEVGHSHAAK